MSLASLKTVSLQRFSLNFAANIIATLWMLVGSTRAFSWVKPTFVQFAVFALLALGSNYQAEKYLSLIREKLAVLGEIQLSTAFQNPDFTATSELPKPDYTNQCVYLTLTSAMTLQQLQQTFKQFESDCGRQRSSESINNPIKIVTMDIDILLIKLDDKQNSLSKKWIIMADRYPFKAYERAGIEELISNRL